MRMHARPWLIWPPVILLGIIAVGVIGIIIALRGWPDQVVPRLPDWTLPHAHLVASEDGRRDISQRLRSLAAHRLLEYANHEDLDPRNPTHLSAQCHVALVLLGMGYDHRMPSQFKLALGTLIHRITNVQNAAGTFSTDPHTHALATMTVAECYAMTNDHGLKAPLQRAARQLMAGGADTWTQDRTLAALTLMAAKSLMAGGVGIPDALEPLQAWWLGIRDEPLWQEHGLPCDPPAWQRSAWNGVFASFLSDRSYLASITLTLPPAAESTPTLATWWLSLAAFMRGSGDYEAITLPLTARGLATYGPAPWHWPRHLDAEAMIGISIALMQDSIRYRYLPVTAVPTKP